MVWWKSGGLVNRKFKDEQKMAKKQSEAEKLAELRDLAREWGKLLAGEAFGPEGPGLDVDLASMEELAMEAAHAMVEGTLKTLVRQQADRLGDAQGCPECGSVQSLERRARPFQVRSGELELEEPVAHCSTCRRDFFPSAEGTED
jgi:hypothetical protein